MRLLDLASSASAFGSRSARALCPAPLVLALALGLTGVRAEPPPSPNTPSAVAERFTRYLFAGKAAQAAALSVSNHPGLVETLVRNTYEFNKLTGGGTVMRVDVKSVEEHESTAKVVMIVLENTIVGPQLFPRPVTWNLIKIKGRWKIDFTT